MKGAPMMTFEVFLILAIVLVIGYLISEAMKKR